MRLLVRRAVLREDAATLLAELGETAAEVGATLGALGVGGPERPGDCPLSRFLYAVVGSDARVKGIRLTNRSLVLETRLRTGPRVWVRLPRPVRDYVVSAQRAWLDDPGDDLRPGTRHEVPPADAADPPG